MQKLRTEFKRYDYLFEQVQRTKHSAVYSQKMDGKVIAYEVIKITVAPAKQVFNTFFPIREVYPSNENWGLTGWTKSAGQLNEAIKKMEEITAVVQEAEKDRLRFDVSAQSRYKVNTRQL